MALHISSILSKLDHLAAIGYCSLQIQHPSLAPLVSVAVVPKDIEKRTSERVIVSVGLSVTLHISSMLSKLVHLAAISCCSLQIHDPSLKSLVSIAEMPSNEEKDIRRSQCQLAYQCPCTSPSCQNWPTWLRLAVAVSRSMIRPWHP